MVAELDAIVLADDPLARERIAGLPAYERAVRVARRVGATRVLVIGSGGSTRDRAVAWRADRTCPVLVIRADQLVHTPLVAPLIEALPTEGVAVAVGPDGADAGAYVAAGTAAPHALAAIARGASDAGFVGAAGTTTRIPHGAIARHPISTRDERAAAHRLLYRILIKPQDNAITRYLYRPISFPLTRLLVWTPITPNQVSVLVAVMVAIGCWLTAHASMTRVIAGTVLILAASYVDCCDGEIARVKLLSSRFGAWIDTVVDELSSIGYMVALGIHCHLQFGPDYFGADLGVDPWLAAVAISLVTFFGCMYLVYYNIIVAVGSANSQDYVAAFVLAPGAAPNAVRLRPAPPKPATRTLPPWLKTAALWVSYLPRRDFVSWLAVVMAVLHLTHVLFGILVLGGALTFVVLARDHLHLRRLRRSVVAAGQVLEAPG